MRRRSDIVDRLLRENGPMRTSELAPLLDVADIDRFLNALWEGGQIEPVESATGPDTLWARIATVRFQT